MEKKNSPRPFATFAFPSSYLSSRANSVAQSGRFSTRARNSNASSYGASSTAVTVRLSTISPFVWYRTK